MKKVSVELIVYVCMFVAIYINWTDFPKQRQIVHGALIKLGVE